jgi:hypothetical protein
MVVHALVLEFVHAHHNGQEPDVKHVCVPYSNWQKIIFIYMFFFQLYVYHLVKIVVHAQIQIFALVLHNGLVQLVQHVSILNNDRKTIFS